MVRFRGIVIDGEGGVGYNSSNDDAERFAAGPR